METGTDRIVELVFLAAMIQFIPALSYQEKFKIYFYTFEQLRYFQKLMTDTLKENISDYFS